MSSIVLAVSWSLINIVACWLVLNIDSPIALNIRRKAVIVITDGRDFDGIDGWLKYF